MKKMQLAALAILCTTAFLSACTAPNAMVMSTTAQGDSSVRTITNNPVLSTRIGVSQVSMTNLGNIKHASLALKNGWYYAQAFEYKIVWLDNSGTEINPEGAIWKPVSLQGREIKTVQSVAPNPSALDIVIYLKKS